MARQSGTGAGQSYYEANVTCSAGGAVIATLSRVMPGKARLTLGNLTAPANTLRPETRGNRVRLEVDGRAPISARNADLARPGRVGVVVSAGRPCRGVGGGDPAAVRRRVRRGSPGGRRAGADGGSVCRLASAGQSVGLLARYAGPLDYDEARLTRNANGTLTAALYRVQNGVAKALKSLGMATAAAGLLRFEVEGTALKLSFNGLALATADAALSASGATGVSLVGGTVDDFTVR